MNNSTNAAQLLLSFSQFRTFRCVSLKTRHAHLEQINHMQFMYYSVLRQTKPTLTIQLVCFQARRRRTVDGGFARLENPSTPFDLGYVPLSCCERS